MIRMNKMDLIIGSCGVNIIVDIIFLFIVNRYDILLVSGSLSLIPLILSLISRRKNQ